MYLAASGFVEHIHFHAIAESGFPFNQYYINILYKAVVSDNIVCDIVLNIFDDDIIANSAIVNYGTIDAGMFF